MIPRRTTDHGVPKQLPGRGENGRRFCRWCHAEVPKGRSSYCNDFCSLSANFGFSRFYALRRDNYKCTFCGNPGYVSGHDPHKIRKDFPKAKLEVDHIVSVKDGGSHHTDNLRTLCHECHVKRTTEQRRERKKKENQ